MKNLITSGDGYVGNGSGSCIFFDILKKTFIS